MTLPTVQDAQYPDPDAVRDAILRAIRFAFARRGLEANVLPGSDHYIRAQAYGARVSIAIANNQLALQDSDPLTATGEALETLAGVFGITRRPAGPAAGNVVITCSGSISIPAGFQCTAPNGKKYQTVVAAVAITTNASIAIIATTGGTETNQDAGTILTWDSASIGALSPNCVVDTGGLSGGAPEDTDETLRDRLLNRLAFPPGGGNSAQVKEWAEESTSSVEVAYVYPAVRGPGSYDVAVTKAGGDRILPATTVAIVRGYVLGKMPGQADGNFTSVVDELIDVVIEASLPYPAAAGGVGGGWRDAAPWPAGETVQVTAYSAPTATVDSVAAPVAGQSIGVWDSTERVMREYTIAATPAVGGSTGAWTFQAEGGFIASPLNEYVSAGAESLVDYAASFAAQMALLGPGEKTDSPELLPRAFRFPSPQQRNPSAITSRLLAAVTNSFEEIANLEYVLLYNATAAATLGSPYTPTIPTATADPPNIFVLRHFAIRAPAS